MYDKICIYIIAIVLGFSLGKLVLVHRYYPIVDVYNKHCTSGKVSPAHARFCEQLSESINSSGFAHVIFEAHSVDY